MSVATSMTQKQLAFLPQPRWWHRYVGRLLWCANCDAKQWDDPRRYAFYAIKRRLLETHAEERGVHWQRIKHTCWACDGTGNWGYWRSDGGDWCFKCSGTGIYRQFYVRLQVYRFGGYEFHIPGERRNTLDVEAVILDGPIPHTKQGRKAEWAFVALLLMFDRAKFRLAVWNDMRRISRKIRRWLPVRCHDCRRWIVRKNAAAILSGYGGKSLGVLCSGCSDQVPF